MGNVSFNFLFRKGYALHTKSWQYHINDRSHLLKVLSILHICIFYEACLQQKSTLAIARKREKTSHLSVHGPKSLVIACIKNSTIG